MCIVICTLLLSRPARGAWVEIPLFWYYYEDPESRPARGAWVEIHMKTVVKLDYAVAPRKGRVG